MGSQTYAGSGAMLQLLLLLLLLLLVLQFMSHKTISRPRNDIETYGGGEGLLPLELSCSQLQNHQLQILRARGTG
jgi:hypothetical protein